MSFRYELVQLLRESTLIQGSVTLAFTVAILYMCIAGQVVPENVWAMYGLVMGYYFGAKSSQQTTNSLREAMANIHVRV